MTATRIVSATLWSVALANLAGAAQIDFDPATLPNLSASALVTAPVSQPADTTTTTLLPNYTPLNVTYDLGNDATASVQEEDLAGSAAAFVTYDGDGTNQITVRINGEGLASGTPPTGGASAQGGGTVDFNLFTRLDNLTPGQQYQIQYQWSVDATAGAPLFYPGASSAKGHMMLSTAYGAPVTLFDEQVNGVVGLQPIHITPSGSGSFLFVANNDPIQTLALDLFATGGASFGGSMAPNPEVNDQVGATFYGEATFTLTAVPEPSSQLTLVIAAGLLGLWRTRRQGRSIVG